MIEFICLFFPAILGVFFEEHLNKKQFRKEEIIRKYLLFTLLTNIFSIIFCMIYYSNTEILTSFDKMFTLTFSGKYLILSALVSLVIAFISQVMKQKVDMSISVKRIKK